VFTPGSLAGGLPEVLARTAERVIAYCGGQEVWRAVV